MNRPTEPGSPRLLAGRLFRGAVGIAVVALAAGVAILGLYLMLIVLTGGDQETGPLGFADFVWSLGVTLGGVAGVMTGVRLLGSSKPRRHVLTGTWIVAAVTYAWGAVLTG